MSYFRFLVNTFSPSKFSLDTSAHRGNTAPDQTNTHYKSKKLAPPPIIGINITATTAIATVRGILTKYEKECYNTQLFVSGSDSDNNKNDGNNDTDIEIDSTLPEPLSRSESVADCRFGSTSSSSSSSNNNNNINNTALETAASVSKAETAAIIARSLLFSLRSLLLYEASILHDSLRFWSSRYEMPPWYSFLLTGPWNFLKAAKKRGVWKAVELHHRELAQKVSTLQAILSRRCIAIGNVQQQFLRSSGLDGGGVMNLRVVGGHWGVVIGVSDRGLAKSNYFGHAGAGNTNTKSNNYNKNNNNKIQSAATAANLFSRSSSEDMLNLHNLPPSPTHEKITPMKAKNKPAISIPTHFQQHLSDGMNKSYSAANFVAVPNAHNASVLKSPFALSAWAVDAVSVVRRELERSIIGGGGEPEDLCGHGNWVERGELTHKKHLLDEWGKIPTWASADEDGENVQIVDLRCMTNEIEELLEVMGEVMGRQRNRRPKLTIPNRLERNWISLCVGFPLLSMVAYKFYTGTWGKEMYEKGLEKVCIFWAEHVKEPCEYLYVEFFTSKTRDRITDEIALKEACGSLKRMLSSWLGDNFPKMSDAEREARSQMMDVSLIEKEFEASVPNAVRNVMTGEIVRSSLIQMQFIKKELLTAMDAIDKLMDSNEFNFRVMAMVPAVFCVWVVRKGVRMILYSFDGKRKSKSDTYGQFRSVLLAIDRLLLMRDNPPKDGEMNYRGGSRRRSVIKNGTVGGGLGYDYEDEDENGIGNGIGNGNGNGNGNGFGRHSNNAGVGVNNKPTVLRDSDLGMLMLLVHQCQLILWKEKRRFILSEVKSAHEDLIELCGERGFVSVSQQRSVIERMYRTYSFMRIETSLRNLDF